MPTKNEKIPKANLYRNRIISCSIYKKPGKKID